MKFWQLLAIMRGESKIVEEELNKPQWKEIYGFYKDQNNIVATQQRNILDMELPNDLVTNMLGKSSKRVYVSMEDKVVRNYRVSHSDKEISPLKALDILSADGLEEVFEKTEANIK